MPRLPPQRQKGPGAAAPPPLSDEELMARLQQGEEPLFAELFRRHGARVYRFLFHASGDPALAEDLSQHTWLQVHRARHTFRTGLRLTPWLYTIAANLLRDSHRRRQRHPETLTRDGTLPDLPGPADPAAPAGPTDNDDERGERVRQALFALPESYREVIVLHRWHDLSFAEIGAALGISEGAVKLRAHRGYLRLREALRLPPQTEREP